MWTKIKTLASLYRELGPRWTLFRLAYAFRLRTGLVRLQMPQYKWDTYRAERSASAVEAPLDKKPKFFPSVGAVAKHPRPGFIDEMGRENLAPTYYHSTL